MSAQKICLGSIGIFLAAALLGCSVSPQAKEAKYLERGKSLLQQRDYARALLEFRNASKLMPKDAEAYYQAGLACLGVNDLVGAVRLFSKATELNPSHAGAQLKLAEMMVNTRNSDYLAQAAKRLETILVNAPDNTEAIGTLAVAEWKLGQTEDAAKRLEETLQKFPNDLRNSVVLAKLKLQQNDAAGAQAVLQKATEIAPQSADAALALGQVYWIAKQPAKAEAEIIRALQLNPKSGTALLTLAALQTAAQRTDEADQTYRRLAALPDKEFKHLHALFLYQNGRRDDAVAELLKLHKENPKDRDARSRLLSVYVATGKTSEAQQMLGAALKENPKDADALFERAELNLRLGKGAAAKDDLNMVLHYKPDSAQAHYVLGEVYGAEGSLQARQEFMEALRVNPGMLPARLALVRSFIKTGDSKAALEVLDAAPQQQKNILGVITERNWALFGIGSLQEMRAQLENALKAGRFPELLVQDAVLKMRDRDYDGARAVANELLRRNPEEGRAARIVADTYVAQKKPQKALRSLTEFAQGHPRSAALQDLLGSYQLENGKLPEARQAFEAAKAADPQFVRADLALAEIDARERKGDDARRRLNSVLAADPKNIPAFMMRADVDMNDGRKAEAIAGYRSAVEIESNNVPALNNLAYLLADENIEEALNYAQQAAALSPDNPAVEDTLGWVYYRKGLYRLSFEHLKRAVAKEATPRRQFHLGMVYLKTGDRELGQRTVMAALAKDPSLTKTEQGW